MSIPLNIEKLLSGAVVEGSRMEFKQGWNPKTIMRTVCAFANDFENEGSGYIVVGVEELDGKPQRPVTGFNPESFEKVQKEMIGYCNLIQPNYMPRLSLEEIDGKHVLVIWVPAGSMRPYKVPDDISAKLKTYNYRIRQYSNSVKPNPEQEAELIQLTARIPFDDRLNTLTGIENLSFDLMRGHLAKIKSKLFNESAGMSIEELAVKMNLCEGAQEHLFPKNVGLLMFAENPKQFFPGVQIDVVEFLHGIDAKEFNEKTFDGAIQIQLTNALSYIQTNIIQSKVKKYADRAEADKIFNYPYEAIEEALANAVYHRNYELREPIEVRVLPEAIEIISYNGVDPSLKQADFEKGVVRVRRYRNRRIGGFLKELELTEGRGTGIPTIFRTLKDNGSPAPVFDTDEPNRSYFVAEIKIHPDFVDTETSSEDNKEGLVESGLIGGLIENVGGQAGESIIKKWNKIYGSVKESVDRDSEKNRILLNDIYLEFMEYLQRNFGRTSEELRENFGRRSRKLRKNFGKTSGEIIPGPVFVLMLIVLDSKVTANEACIILGTSSRTIETYLRKLRESKLIERIGSTKDGYWRILNK